MKKKETVFGEGFLNEEHKGSAMDGEEILLPHDLVIVADGRLPLVNVLADYFDVDVVHADLRSFADTESIVQVEDPSRIQDKLVLLVPMFSFGRKKVCKGSINDQLIQILLLAHQVKAHRAKGLIALMPYLPYSRQSRSVSGLYVGSLQAVGTFFHAVGIDHVIACELHDELCRSIFPLPLHEVSLHDMWSDVLRAHFSQEEFASLCFVSPDRGGINRVKKIAELFGASWTFVEKKRVDYDESVAVKLLGDVKEKVVVLIDDIIDTGRTAVEAAKMVLQHGAKKVVGCFTHAVLSEGAIDRVEKSDIEKVWITNSIILDAIPLSSKFSVVSLDDAMTQYLKDFLKKG